MKCVFEDIYVQLLDFTFELKFDIIKIYYAILQGMSNGCIDNATCPKCWILDATIHLFQRDAIFDTVFNKCCTCLTGA